MSDFSIYEQIESLNRKIQHMVVHGVVSAVDLTACKAKVRYGENEVTGWLPWQPIKTGQAVIWWPLEVGEAVTVISPGLLNRGIILPSVYYEKNPAPSSDENKFIVRFKNGNKIEHDLAISY